MRLPTILPRMLLPVAIAAAANTDGVTIPFTLPRAGKVSLAVYDDTGGNCAIHLYLDGHLAVTGNGPGESGIERLALGASNQLADQSFIGTFDEIRIYQRTLPAEEIAALAKKNLKN